MIIDTEPSGYDQSELSGDDESNKNLYYNAYGNVVSADLLESERLENSLISVSQLVSANNEVVQTVSSLESIDISNANAVASTISVF